MNKKQLLGLAAIAMMLILISANGPKEGKKTAGPGGAILTRTITPSSVEEGGVFTIQYDISGANGNYGGIIYETIPAGFTINSLSFLNNMDVFGKKITGQLIEMPFTGIVSGQFIRYEITASTSSGVLSSGYVEWADNAGTDTLSTANLDVGGAACIPDCACASSTCTGSTCADGCGGTCPGTMDCTTCSSQGGSCCLSNQACSGTVLSATDCTFCCSGTCTDLPQTCSEMGGQICTAGTTCDSSIQAASDTTECCQGNCVSDSCTPSWSCTDYSPATCPSSCSQSRSCTDLNGCGVTTGMPPTTQSCTGGDCATTPPPPVSELCGSVECELWEECNAEEKCELASWVYIVIAGFALMWITSMMR